MAGPMMYNDMHSEFDNQPVTWPFVASIVGFAIVGIQFVLGVQVLNPRRAEVWSKPSWRANPFQLKQPAQFFHLGGWYFVAAGLSAAIYTRMMDPGNFMFVLPLAFGVGLVVGVNLAVFVFRSMFRSGQDAA